MKILVATEKPFARKAIEGITQIVTEAGYELALLEKYTDKTQLLEAVADADGLIIRSDKAPFIAVLNGRGTGKTFGALKYAIESKIPFILMTMERRSLNFL